MSEQAKTPVTLATGLVVLILGMLSVTFTRSVLTVHRTSAPAALATPEPVPVTVLRAIQADDANAVHRLDDHLLWLPIVAKAESSGWPMAGANPERTSWTPEQVPSAEYLAAHRNQWNNGKLYLQWYKPIEPYIPRKVQVIAANDTLYISTAKGLYALDAATGSVKWVYPTEMPLGHSPTIHNGVVYVGGLDHRLYAINASTGQKLWAFEAEQGFQTNPLVVGGLVYAGNRDGHLYAVYADEHAQRGALAWKFKADGPVLFSAAYKDHTVYFASEDSHAYALDAASGALVWKSARLPGAGFHSWWPVVYQNVVVLAGSSNYRDNIEPGPKLNIDVLDREVYPNGQLDRAGIPVGPRAPDGWLDTSRANTTVNGSTKSLSDYLEEKPWRRTYFVLDRLTGQEVTFDFDGDRKKEYAPVLWFGTQSGNRYPPLVGPDGIIYQSNNYMSAPWIAGGGISGWRFGAPFISTPSSYWHAIDEPVAYAAGGNIVYWAMHTDLAAGAFDLSAPNTRFWDNGQPDTDYTRQWDYWSYDLGTLAPGYNEASFAGYEEFGGRNGVYGMDGDQNPPVPYKGRVYIHRGNSILALGMAHVQPVRLPLAQAAATQSAPAVVSRDQLRQRLAAEVDKILDAGHLRPGYVSSGLIDVAGNHLCGDNLQDYWHDPAESLYTLIRALPHLPADLQQRTRTYLQAEFSAYPPYQVTHIGWKDGAPREAFELPPEVESDRVWFGPTEWASFDFPAWGERYGGTNYPPSIFYVLWKYAETLSYTQAQARSLFDASKGRLSRAPADDVLAKYPFAHNAYIVGYRGYLELERLAGYPETSRVRSELDRLLVLRTTGFAKDTPYLGRVPDAESYCRAFSASRNFLFLTPELGDYLHDNALTLIRQALDEYTRIEPYWFVAKYEDTFGEAIIQPLYDYYALFQARALILKEPYTDLVKYIDVPAVQVGDLYYIQNLVAAIEARD